ncbi:ABC transporter ATP-binding protein [Hufsiella ginkgonis]|uniref:Dipeptide ABC transporter ATP-binding protein n=1 Tax=Hufsiella ginkgonis TaxID=2695274 RepID=A0A7K1XXI8_9SPHI|nr:ABC transporter ATP-binding protein [Hufsiella ginkgonis]MXV15449.1 dipeptide ABC transporter ATP-binding protein [Hufsiella ginkgonis]
MISAENLAISFRTETGWAEVVQGISFTLQPGNVLGIVGESGSGKSVAALSIMRLHDPSATRITGSIRFHDTDLMAIPEKEMRRYRGKGIAMIFQEPMTSLNPVLTCGFQVAEAIRLHRKISVAEAREKTISLFNEVQLPRPEKIFDSYPHELSGGQKQRVMIAMALSGDPEVLIADEPTTALDVTVQHFILQLLLKIKSDRNMSMIFISHDLGVIRKIADHVLVMHKGNIVESNTLDALFAHPQHPYTKGLLASRPVMGQKLKVLPMMSDFIDINGEKPAFVPVKLTDRELDSRLETLHRAPPLLQVRNLKTWYPVKEGFFGKPKEFVKAVDDVSFDVYPGEIVGLVGESGCGKTTLGRSIARLIEPTSGSILFKGKELLGLPATEMRKYRRNIQIIFQDPFSALNPVTTIGESLLEPMRVHQLFVNDNQRREQVISLLERVNLSADHFNRYPHEFSGGQRQRIGIARALALRPEFIICDESVSALDVSVQAQVLNLLQELQREFKLTYIFISHDLSVIYHLADRMIVMNKGKIEESGDPRQILYHPKEAYTKKLIGSIV